MFMTACGIDFNSGILSRMTCDGGSILGIELVLNHIGGWVSRRFRGTLHLFSWCSLYK